MAKKNQKRDRAFELWVRYMGLDPEDYEGGNASVVKAAFNHAWDMSKCSMRLIEVVYGPVD